MVFSSSLFIFLFLPVTLFLYWVAYRSSLRAANIVLLLFSMLFYAWGGVKYLVILLFVIIINYLLVRIMQNKTSWRKALFLLSLAIDIGNLFYFKYFNFFVENMRGISHLIGYQMWENVGAVVLPIGISFYTFQIISYVVDVYTRKVEVQKDPVKFSLYVLMFPQLIAGPIVRYTDINRELDSRSILTSDVEEGIKRFIIGFAKKVFIANAMGSMADTVFAIAGGGNTVYAWLGAICYSLQIYYDFSAYSDMAIGIGRMLGFHFQENFNLPYRSKSIQEFWRRWHISLSSWFRDYVYIPLGGNRKGKVWTYLNLAVVFLLTGLWHGAAWQFIIWGAYHGLFLVIERLGFNKVLGKIPSAIRHVYTMVVVIVGWVFFRADDLPKALVYLRNMFSWNFSGFKQYLIVEQFSSLFWICLIVAIIFAIVDCKPLTGTKKWNTSEFVKISYLVLWGLSVLYLVGLSYNPFIYFKF